jgi:hypothetical protein
MPADEMKDKSDQRDNQQEVHQAPNDAKHEGPEYPQHYQDDRHDQEHWATLSF